MSDGDSVSLKEHYAAIISAKDKLLDIIEDKNKEIREEIEKKYEERFKGQQEALKVATELLKEYKIEANNVRSLFVLKTEFELFTTQVDVLNTKSSKEEGRHTGISSTWAAIASVILFCLSVGSFLLGHFVFK